jgi:very-short-patch-repair endonuclease
VNKDLNELPVRIKALLCGAGFTTEEELLIYLGNNPRKLLEIEGLGLVAYKFILEWLNNTKLYACEARYLQRKEAKKEAVKRWENLLAHQIRAYKLTGYKVQHRFDNERLWTFDFAFIKEKLAVEIDGGLHIRGGGGHNSRKGYSKDREKDQAAILQGWTVYRVTPQMVRTGEVINSIVKVLESRRKTTI